MHEPGSRTWLEDERIVYLYIPGVASRFDVIADVRAHDERHIAAEVIKAAELHNGGEASLSIGSVMMPENEMLAR